MPQGEGNRVVFDDLLADLPPEAVLQSKINSARWYMELMECAVEKAAARYGIDPALLVEEQQEKPTQQPL